MFKKLSCDCIAALIPTYTPEGDSTILIRTDGSYQKIDRRVKTVLNHLARSLSIDLVSLKAKSALATEKSNFQPLPLAPGLVLCPVKLRQPLVPGDTTVGYINFHSVSSVTKHHTKPYQSTVRLMGGTDIPILWTTTTVKQRLQQARLALSHTAYDSEVPLELSIHLYHIIKAIYRMTSSRHPSDQNFVPIP